MFRCDNHPLNGMIINGDRFLKPIERSWYDNYWQPDTDNYKDMKQWKKILDKRHEEKIMNATEYFRIIGNVERRIKELKPKKKIKLITPQADLVPQ